MSRRILPVLALVWLGCQTPTIQSATPDPGSAGRGVGGSPAAPGALGGSGGAAGGSGGNSAGGASGCAPLTCTPTGGHYCGSIGDGCGVPLECGDCPAGETCGARGIQGVCGKDADPSCKPLSCTQPGVTFCGRVGDGCGGALTCGGCSGGETCGGSGVPGVCRKPRDPGCKPLICQRAGGQLCGRVGDGCGGLLDCGDCSAGLTCGGGGSAGVCGKPVDPACRPVSCSQAGGQLCGRVGDGCGRALDCGACPGGAACDNGVCPGSQGPMTPGACDGLCKQQMKCPNGDTTVTGTVFAPTPPKFGNADPLYNVLVYVPNAPVLPFPRGVSCDQCGRVSGAPLVVTLTGSDGKFTLRNVPVGTDIPLVIQVGRWRRQVKIPRVSACTNTALPAELTRLPRNQSEGEIPAMALATGQWDYLECTLRKIGIDDAEFTNPDGNGRVHVWHGGSFTERISAATPMADALMNSLPTLSQYDGLLLPCHLESPKPKAQQANLESFANQGGRVFLTDYSFSWLKDGNPAGFEGVVTWKPAHELVEADNDPDYEVLVDAGFPKGMAFRDWLTTVGASPMPGHLVVHDIFGGSSDVQAVLPPTQRWLYTEGAHTTVQHFTFNTPLGAGPDKQCGRVVFSQFHMSRQDLAGPDEPIFPEACDDRPLAPHEKALEFMLFDAAACVMPDDRKPEPPSVYQPPPLPPPSAPPPPPPGAPPTAPPEPPPLIK